MFNSLKIFARKKGSFRFLNLPKEIRLMVYDRLPREIKHTHIILDERSDQITLVRPYMELTILCTCQTIYSEANHLVQRSITRFILDKPPRGIGGTDSTQPSLAFGTLARLSMVQLHTLYRGVDFLDPDILCQRFRQRYPATMFSEFHEMADWLLTKSVARDEIITYIKVSAVQLLRQRIKQKIEQVPKFRLEYAFRCESILHGTPADTFRSFFQVVDASNWTSLKHEGIYVALVGHYSWPHGLMDMLSNSFRRVGLDVGVQTMLRKCFFKLRGAIQADRILPHSWFEEQIGLDFANWGSSRLTQWRNMPTAVEVYADPHMSFEHWQQNWRPTVLTYAMTKENSATYKLAFQAFLDVGSFLLRP